MDILTEPTTCSFDGFLVDFRARALFRLDNVEAPTRVSIGGRAFDILCVLLGRGDLFVSKQELLETIWPGVTVEENNLTVQISALRRVLDAGRPGVSCIQNVPGRGYRFLPEVVRFADGAVEVAGAGAMGVRPSSMDFVRPDLAEPVARRRRRPGLRILVVLAGLLVVAVAGSLAWYKSRSPLLRNERPPLSIVVLPFKNLSDDHKDDYLADGITDDVTTDLSVLPGMFVIARSAADTYKGEPEDPRRIGEKLGVRYLLEGSMRRVGDAVRVNAQLIATRDGAHLWADRFDQQVADLNAGQDEIVRRIGVTLSVAMWDIESARSKRERPTNPDAFDLILRARSISLHPMGPQESLQRLALFEQALSLDPSSIIAMTGLAAALIDTWQKGDELGRAGELVAKAAAINPNHQFVLSVTAYLLYAEHRYSDAIRAYQRLLAYYPNDHRGYAMVAWCLMATGRTEDAIPIIEKAIAHSPRDAYIANRYSDMGFAMLLVGRDEDAIVWTQRALAEKLIGGDRQHAWQYIRMAAAYARLGRLDEAHRAVAEANRLWPFDTVRSHWPDDSSSPEAAAQIKRFQAALRLAGHRDHADEEADFGVAADERLHQENAFLASLTPTTVPGARTIRTAELQRLVSEERPIVIDTLGYFWGRSIPGAIGLDNAGWGASTSDGMQARLRRKMRDLAGGDMSRAIVAVGWNSERFDGRNLALRLVALGYSNVYWYRGGREAWEVNGLPEAELIPAEW